GFIDWFQSPRLRSGQNLRAQSRVDSAEDRQRAGLGQNVFMAWVISGEVLRPHFGFLVLGVGVQNRAIGTHTTGACSADDHHVAIGNGVWLVTLCVLVPTFVFPQSRPGLTEPAAIEGVCFSRCHFKGGFRATAGAGQLFELLVADSTTERARAENN